MIVHLSVIQAVWMLAALAGAFAFKHYLADFVLQNNWIARRKERRDGWLVALLIHAGTHGAFTLAIALAVAPRLWWLALVDIAIHFVIDRIKTLISLAGGWKVEDEKFWWLMGADQFLHQATNIGLAAAILLV